jgi:hypothetical protein
MIKSMSIFDIGADPGIHSKTMILTVGIQNQSSDLAWNRVTFDRSGMTRQRKSWKSSFETARFTGTLASPKGFSPNS